MSPDNPREKRRPATICRVPGETGGGKGIAAESGMRTADGDLVETGGLAHAFFRQGTGPRPGSTSLADWPRTAYLSFLTTYGTRRNTSPRCEGSPCPDPPASTGSPQAALLASWPVYALVTVGAAGLWLGNDRAAGNKTGRAGHRVVLVARAPSLASLHRAQHDRRLSRYDTFSGRMRVSRAAPGSRHRYLPGRS